MSDEEPNTAGELIKRPKFDNEDQKEKEASIAAVRSTRVTEEESGGSSEEELIGPQPVASDGNSKTQEPRKRKKGK